MLKSLTRILKPLLQKYKILEDIIIFGSLVREKPNPKDIDIAVFIHEKNEAIIEKIEKDIKDALTEFEIDITILTVEDIYSPLWLSITYEGWSINKEEFFSVLYNIMPSKLYKYSIRMLTPVQKVQFDRGLKAILNDLGGIRMTRTVVLIPLQKSEMFEEFLKTWRIEFETRRYSLLPEYQKPSKISI